MLNDVKTVAIGIEPFAEPDKHLSDVQDILTWFGSEILKVYFVGVLNPDDIGWPKDIDDEAWRSKLQQMAASKIRENLELNAFGVDFEVKIFVQKNASKSESVVNFLKFAEEKEVDLLVVHSNTKSNLRALLGSFCSKLIHKSQIPILVIPFEGHVSKQLISVLFPTDFSGLSKRVFNSVVRWAIHLKANVNLYHRLARPIDEILQIALHPSRSKTVMPSDIVLLTEGEMKQKSKEWLDSANQENSAVIFEMNSEGITLTEAILEQAKRQKVQLIALPTHSSEVNVLSLGSAVNHVLRTSPIPVLIVPVPYIHPGDFPQ